MYLQCLSALQIRGIITSQFFNFIENDRDEETLPETVDDSKLKKDLILNEVATTFKQPPVKPVSLLTAYYNTILH